MAARTSRLSRTNITPARIILLITPMTYSFAHALLPSLAFNIIIFDPNVSASILILNVFGNFRIIRFGLFLETVEIILEALPRSPRETDVHVSLILA
jgi:hypothetical protein